MIFLGNIVFSAVGDQVVSMDLFSKKIQFSNSISMMLALSAMTFIPFFLLTTTSFLRIIIVLGTMRMAMGTQQSPPNPVLIAVALFMTIFIMSGVWGTVNKDALIPYNQGKITQDQAVKRAIVPIKQFMLKHVREDDLALFVEFSRIEVKDITEVPIWVVIPAFIMSEITAAFSIAFVIFIPFVLIDLIMANILLSLGMFMLSPVMVSLPFKILLFVLADGFTLITRGLLVSFQ